MPVDTGFESLYNQVQLVRGPGNRRKGQLCLMSLVALLAGEGHSDNPTTASAVIRRFAMIINDEMPAAMRQRLKPFAPLIVGTCDGRDGERVRLLSTIMCAELLPRIKTDFCDTGTLVPLPKLRPKNITWPEIYQQLTALLSSAAINADVREYDRITTAATRLICLCGRVASLPDQQAWYWAKAVDLLDRLCTVGNEEPRSKIPEGHLNVLAAYLQQQRHRATLKASGWNLSGAWTRARDLIPVLVK